MNDPDDQWARVLDRGVAALEFRLINGPHAPPFMSAQPREDLGALPVMVQTAAQAAAEVDRWVVAGQGDIPIPRAMILSRRHLVASKVKEPPGSTPSPFTTGYTAAYRLGLAKLLWAAICDHPSRRLKALAAPRPEPDPEL